MPPVVIPIVQALAGAIVAIGGGTFGALAVATVISTTVGVGLYGLAINAVMKALGPKKPKGSGRGLDQQLYDAAAPGRILFGQVRVGGAHVLPPIVTANVETGGSKPGMRSHRVLALAIHEIDSFVTTYGDQTEITNASIHAVTGTASTDGRVESGKWAPNGTSTTYLWIRRYVGSSTQTTDAMLAAIDGTAFSANFRGRGIACAAITYGWSGSGSGYLWQSGLPDFTFTVKGMKVYDPRLDSTNGGAGTQRYATPSTWAWSANPAIIAGTFLMFDEQLGGGGYDPATEIDWALVAAAANICDANVDSNTGASNRDRYTCNLVLDASAMFEDNLSDIIDCMMGRCVWRDGKWRIYAGAWDTATFTINKEDWISPLTIQTIAPRREGRWNGVRCFYVDPSRNYQRVEAYPRTSATYYEDDANERIWLEIERAGCNSESEAQMHAEFLLRQSRNQIKVTGRLGPKFQYLALWETGVINHAELGWTSKTFRLATYKLNADGSVDVGFSEEQSTDWTDLAQAEYGAPSTATLPETNVQAPDEPTALSIGETVAGTLLATLTPGEVKPLGTTYQLYASPGTLWNSSSAQLAWEGDAKNIYVPYTPTIMSWWHVRAHHGSYYSAFYPNTYGTFLMLTPKADNTTNNRVVPDADFSVGTPAYWTGIADGAGYTLAYATSLGGASAGAVRFTKTNSLSYQPGIAARPHPNQVNTIGYPNAGTRMYWGYMKFRVNSYVAIGSYGGTNSGGFMQFYVMRTMSGEYANTQFLPAQYLDGVASPIAAPMWSTCSLGTWYEFEDAVTVTKLTSNWPTFDFGAIKFMDAAMNSGTQVDVDRFSLTDMGFVNVPVGKPLQCNTFATNIELSYRYMAAYLKFNVGSCDGFIPSNTNRDYWWEVNAKVYVSKPNSTQGPCYIRTNQTSDFLTIVGTISQVHTITLRAAGPAEAIIQRVGTYNYIIDGYGIT